MLQNEKDEINDVEQEVVYEVGRNSESSSHFMAGSKE